MINDQDTPAAIARLNGGHHACGTRAKNNYVNIHLGVVTRQLQRSNVLLTRKGKSCYQINNFLI